MKIDYKVIILISIILIAGVLRLQSLDKVGLKFYDEGVYLIEANYLNGNKIIEYDWLNSLKPFHDIMISWSLNIFGNYDWSGLLVSAILGILTVLVVFLIGKELYNWKTGLIASLLMALNGLHIIYSRTVLAEIGLTFFIALTILFYILGKKRGKYYYLLLAGISAGLAFETKYFGVLVLFIILISEIVNFKDLKTFTKNNSLILIPFIIVFLVGWGFYEYNGIDYMYNLLGYARVFKPGQILIDSLFPNILVKEVTGSSGVAVYGLGVNAGLFEVVGVYFYYILKTIGPLIMLFTAFGFWKLIKKMKFEDKLLLSWLLFLIIFLISVAHIRDRDLIMLTPIMSLVAAKGFDFFKNNKLKIFSLIIVILIAVPIAINASSYYNQNYKQAAEFLIENSAENVYATVPTILAYYMNKPVLYINETEQGWFVYDDSEYHENSLKTINYEFIYRKFYSIDNNSLLYKTIARTEDKYLRELENHTKKRSLNIVKY